MKTYVLMLTLLLLAGCGRSRPQLLVFTWRNNINAAVVAEFEQRFECQVVQDYFDSAEAAAAKLSGTSATILGGPRIASFDPRDVSR